MMNGNSQNLLSVLIPNHNYGTFIAEAIASVCDQSYSPIELVVVDDGSTDDSIAVIEAALADADNLHRVEFMALKENIGKLGAMNASLDKLCGEYCIILDADDRLEPGYAERCIAEIKAGQKEDPHLGFVYSDCLLMDKGGKIIERGRSTPFDKDLLQQYSYVPEPALMMTRALLEIAPMDETIRVATKHHKWLRIVENGWTGKHIAEPLFYYRMHDRNLSGIGKRVITEVEAGRRGERILSGYWPTSYA